MKKMLSEFRSFGIGIGAILFIFLLQTKPISAFLKPHPLYFVGFILVLFMIIILIVYLKAKKLQSLPPEERNVLLRSFSERKNTSPILKSHPNLTLKKYLLFLLLAFVGYMVIVMAILNFMDENGFPSWLATNFPYLLLAAILLTFSVYNYTYNLKNERKVKRSLQEKEGIILKLRSIRSQLNPHFMFNALTSIQNLMNKNDIPAANHYLTMFADLTRRVLNTGDQELISLEDELKILEDYLQMEQLRFGFQYQITVDGSINISNTEIPAMLLQPFVENAVKHGVAMLHQNGTIKLQIDKQQNDLVLFLTDNGQGFDKIAAQTKTDSFGLKLSEERIALLNQIHPGQPVTLVIDAKQTGTTVTIKLANLLS